MHSGDLFDAKPRAHLARSDGCDRLLELLKGAQVTLAVVQSFRHFNSHRMDF